MDRVKESLGPHPVSHLPSLVPGIQRELAWCCEHLLGSSVRRPAEASLSTPGLAQTWQGSTVCPVLSAPLPSRPALSCPPSTQTSVFTPAYGSVTNVRVNSTMTTLQVLTLLLNKFRVSGAMMWVPQPG